MAHADTKAKETLGEVMRRPPRRMRTISEKRRIVEETLRPGASVALVARRHEVNANLVFGWRRLYQQGLLEEPRAQTLPLLPVKLSVPKRSANKRRSGAEPSPLPRAVAATGGYIEIEFASGERVCVRGRVEREALCQVIEVLLRR
jgi:transposase